MLWHRQVEAGLSLICVATCVSMFLREAPLRGVRGAQCGLQSGASEQWGNPEGGPTLTPALAVTLPPEPAQLGPLDAPKLGVRVEGVNKSPLTALWGAGGQLGVHRIAG